MTKTSIILLCLQIFCLTSCFSDCKEYSIKKINFTDNIVKYSYEYDKYYGGINSEYKLLISYDSLMCGLCSINRLSIWNDVLEYAENNNDYFSVIIIFSPKQNESDLILHEIKRNPIDYPLYFDENNTFSKSNRLPKGLFVCLLDSNNSVILYGNPLLNDNYSRYQQYFEEKSNHSFNF